MRTLLRICLPALAVAAFAAPLQAAPADRRVEARAIYADVVAMRTAPGQAKVPEMARYLADRFRAAGFPDADITIVPHKDTAALVVRYRGDGSSGKKPVLAIAHMDVVDALASDWSRDPYRLIEEDGYLYGRGAWDNKAGLVAITSAFLRLKAEGFTPDRDLILVFSGDEETTGGTTALLAREHRALVDAEYALNSDGGGGAFDAEGRLMGYGFQTSEKTYATFRLTTRNKGGHSSAPRRDNAIYQLSAALVRLGASPFPPQINDTTRAMLVAEAERLGPTSEVGRAMARFVADPSDRSAADRIEEDDAYVGWTRTTCVATMLEGGHAENALPQTAVATVNCRIFPGEALDSVRARLAATVADPAITIQQTAEVLVAPGSALRADVLEAYTRTLRRTHPEVKVLPTMSMGATDGNIWRYHGVPTYGVDGMWVVTPEDDRAHGRDERVPVKAFEQNLDHWYWLLKDVGRAAR